MKKTFIYIGLIFCVLFAALSCHLSQENFPDQPVLYVDVSQTYPVKDIELSDIADISYLKLELDEDYLFSASPAQITENYVVIINGSNGDVTFYNR